MLAYRLHRIRTVVSPAISSLVLCVCSPSLGAQDKLAQNETAASAIQTAGDTNAPADGTSAPAAKAFPDLTIPADADAEQLLALIAQAKSLKPRNAHQYQAMQTAIRDGSKRLVKLLGKSGDDTKVAHRVQQAELDTISSSVALMAFVGEDAQQKTLEQVHEFLKGRKELSLQDMQTGVLAAAMLELQPDKKPARDTYQLLCDLLENDEREEMQSLRLNLQASIGRLDLLGSKFELEATSLDGRDIRIDDYAGKFVIVDFFASWCEPCLTEVPRLQKQFEKYKDKGLAVIAISLDADANALDKYLQRAELPWPIIHDNHEDPLQRLQMKFGVSHLPTVLLLNKEGTVVSLEARGAELDRLMQMLFESPTLADPAPPPPGEPPVETPPEKLESRVESSKS
ncbi:MAG: TlpA family protein disulfide reductase [Planctomycetales bacterium]|nr:TlpA family protein disulfide reductase [Planctomycetales bacterium]